MLDDCEDQSITLVVVLLLFFINLIGFSLNWAILKQICIFLLETKHFCVVLLMEEHKYA
jgi:hypothetical protein